MPTASAILEQLFHIANRYREIAIAWHLAVAVVAILVLRGWRPSLRVGAVLLAAPLASVAIAAGLTGNPFNAAVLGLLAGALVVMGHTASPRPLRTVQGYAWVLPAGLIGFGLIYPHFLEAAPWYAYGYAAPVGLLPCPTLALVMGVTLAVRGLDLRPWCWLLAGAALFYGLLGVVRLGVSLDLPLLVGVPAMVARALGGRDPRRSGRPWHLGPPAPARGKAQGRPLTLQEVETKPGLR